MSNDLRLQVVLQTIDKASAVLRKIQGTGGEAARQLKETRDRLRDLTAQQKLAGEFREVRAGLRDTTTKLGEAQARVQDLARTIGAAGPPSRAMARDFENAKRTAAALGQQHDKQSQQVQALRDRLSAAGISTRELGAHERSLRADIASTTAAVADQTAKLRAQAQQAKRLTDLKAQHAKAMLHTGMVAGSGIAAMAAGQKMASPLRSTISAFMPAEDAQTQLRVSMMDSAGKVLPEYRAIEELATRLGDRLPGTTAEFLEMMTMLRRQGLSAQSILGGTAESAAYLGVQLKMPVTAAAEFAAKMQDATQTTEADMMGLMDVIQRTYYLGVDPSNMLQGFTKMAAVMPFLGKKGLEASQMMAPLLVMMDQTGMAGESAGNAIRKVVQLGLDRDKVDKTNKLLSKDGIKLNFSDKQGNFAGLDNLFAQLDKLKGITSDERRIAAMKKLFGDDAETHQVLNTMMEKGITGYREAAEKMQAQAALRMRVNEALGTVSASAEAAQGSVTNMMKDIGATVAPDLVRVLNALGGMAVSVGAWVRENAGLVRWIMLGVAAVAALTTVLGVLALAIASVMGPMLVFRFLLARFALTPAFGTAMVASLNVLRVAFMTTFRAIFGLLLRNPIVMLALGIGGFVASIISNWSGIMAAFKAGDWSAIGGYILEGLKSGLNAATLGLYDAMRSICEGVISVARWIFGIQSPSTVFAGFGGMLIDGLVIGIQNGMARVKDAIQSAATATLAWFKEKLGIQSPSRVFMVAGTEIGNGAALGIESRGDRVRQAAAALTASALVAMPAGGALAADGALRIDSRPALSAAPPATGGGAGGGDTITINIAAAPGMDAQAIARAVRAELQRAQRERSAAGRSALTDID